MPSRYRLDDFDYEFPTSAIAQRPLTDRSASRLLVLHRNTGRIEHRVFSDFIQLPQPGDAIVLNTSRVIAARLTGTRTNGREAEILLVHPTSDDTWLTMVHPGGKLKVGRTVQFSDDACAEITEVLTGGMRKVRFTGSASVAELMNKYGSVPLPPYIDRAPDESDVDRYQTTYATVDGSVAAPTAGLHFTQQMLETLRAQGAQIAELVLHVGPGSFKPVGSPDPADHQMHAEWYSVPDAAADTVNRVRQQGGRVWAVGTTSARVLETASHHGRLSAGSGWTDLFVYPPHEFQMVDALLTNFHLPRSTLLMLVAAFAGLERVLNAYREAVASGYRLFSYGDVMAIV